MNHLITLLDLLNRLDDAVCSLKLAGHEPGHLMAAGLADRARRQVKRAALYLAHRQWDAAVDAEIDAEGFELAEDYPIALPLPERTSGPRTHTNGHPKKPA